MKKIRESNLELLRIIAMFLIVLCHSVSHGAYFNLSIYDVYFFKNHVINFSIANLIYFGGELSVSIFILITGYFSVQSNFRLNKIYPIIFQTFCYSILGLLVGMYTNQKMSVLLIIKQIFPVIFSQYWFITTYIVLFIASPFIVQALKNMNKKFHLYLFIFLFIIAVLIPTVLPNSLSVISNNLLNFILLFITGYFLKFYKFELILSKKWGYIFSISSIIFYIMSIFIIEFISYFTERDFFRKAFFFANLNSLFIFICSIGIFLIFKQLSLRNSKIINNISKLMFGIYLIHENRFVRPIIWGNIFNLYDSLKKEPLLFAMHIFIASITTFFICGIIEFVRQKIFMNLQFNFLNSKLKKIDKYLNRIIEKG